MVPRKYFLFPLINMPSLSSPSHILFIYVHIYFDPHFTSICINLHELFQFSMSLFPYSWKRNANNISREDCCEDSMAPAPDTL